MLDRRYDRIFGQGYGTGQMPQANIQRQYQTPYGLTPPMALKIPAPPTSAAPVTNPFILPMFQKIVENAKRQRLVQSQAEATADAASQAAATAAASPAASSGTSGLPSSLGAAFSADPMSPTGRAISAASIAGLRGGGWSPTPVSFGQVIGDMGAAAQQAYMVGKKAEIEEAARKAAADKAAFDRRLAIAQFFQKEREIGGVKSKEAKAQQVQEARLRRDLRKDFESDAKYFGEAQQFWRDVVNYSKPQQSSASDLALVFSYMKMLDPDSVVREGEQMQVKGLGGIGAEARALLSRLGVTTEGTYEGGMLIINPEIRANIREAAALRYGDLAKSQAALEKYTSEEGSRAGLSTDFFKSKIKGDGNMKRPYVVNSIDDLPDTAKSGDYAVINGVFMQIREQS